MKTTTIFSVQTSLPLHHHLRVVGNVPELGKWSPFESLELKPSGHPSEADESRTWSAEIPIKEHGNFFYRYLICEYLKRGDPNLFAVVKCGPLTERKEVTNVVDDGTLDASAPTWFDGWLLHETEVHLTIHNAEKFPITLLHCNSSSNPGPYRIKVSVINLDKDQECIADGAHHDVVVKVVGDYCSSVSSQHKLGIIYESSKHYSFVIQVLDVCNTVFNIEIYSPNEKELNGSQLLGNGFIYPGNFKGSRGILDVSLLNESNPVGTVQVEYLLIKPLEDISLHDMEDCNERNWQVESRTLNMGHRGCGATFSTSKRGIQENTIESFLRAYEKGADGVELDVHVTKDLQPVIYHDLDVKTLFKTKDGSSVSHMIPVHQLTYKELQRIEVEHTDSPELNSELQARDDLNCKIFPTLEEVLTSLPSNCHMELEVKYLETEKDKEDDPFLDVNAYVDAVLKAVLRNIGKRKLILMGFSPVIVQMMSKKQKRVPVKLGICGETEKYPVYKDIRVRTVGMAVGFCYSERILGLSCFCEHVIADAGIIKKMKERNLVLSTWGEDNNKEDARRRQSEIGVNVLCFDRIHEVLSK